MILSFIAIVFHISKALARISELKHLVKPWLLINHLIVVVYFVYILRVLVLLDNHFLVLLLSLAIDLLAHRTEITIVFKHILINLHEKVGIGSESYALFLFLSMMSRCLF